MAVLTTTEATFFLEGPATEICGIRMCRVTIGPSIFLIRWVFLRLSFRRKDSEMFSYVGEIAFQPVDEGFLIFRFSDAEIVHVMFAELRLHNVHQVFIKVFSSLMTLE